MTSILIINVPGANEEAAVDGMGGNGNLVYASGVAPGSQIAEIKVLCEPIADQATDPTFDCAKVKTDGKSVYPNPDGSWSVTNVPGAKYKQGDDPEWNVLHVCTFYYGYPSPPPTLHETQKFKGVPSSTTAAHGGGQQVGGRMLPAHTLAQALDSSASLKQAVSRLIDLIDTY